MPFSPSERARSLVAEAAVDARDAADRLYALQLVLRASGDALPVQAVEVSALQRRANEIAETLREIETRRGW